MGLSEEVHEDRRADAHEPQAWMTGTLWVCALRLLDTGGSENVCLSMQAL